MRKDIFYYFRKSIAFFDLKARSIPPIVFIIILALYSIYFYINQTGYIDYSFFDESFFSADGAAAPMQASYPFMAAGIIIMLIINVVSFVYLDAVIREAKHEEYTGGDCVKSALRCFPRLIGVSILKNMILAAGFFLFIIPGIYFAIVLIFAECAILDKNNKTIASLKFSGFLTQNRRGEIFKIVLFCNLIVAFIVILLLLIFSSNNVIVFLYILLFMLSICMLIEHKLVAHLYVDALASREGPIAVAENTNKLFGGDGKRIGGDTKGGGGASGIDEKSGGGTRDTDDSTGDQSDSGDIDSNGERDGADDYGRIQGEPNKTGDGDRGGRNGGDDRNGVSGDEKVDGADNNTGEKNGKADDNSYDPYSDFGFYKSDDDDKKE